MKRQLLVSISVILFLTTMTTLIILYGKGYRFGFSDGSPKLAKTGILNATSTPHGARVYINDHLTSATNNTVNLTPGKYTIRIEKDGYAGWRKDVQIEQQVVSTADALLFPSAPTLQPISTFGVESPVLDPSGTKLAFHIASQSAKRNGVYILDMTTRSFQVLVGQSSSTQIADDTTDFFSQAQLSWSPDGEQLLASISGALRTPTYYLLQTNGFNETPQDVTATLDSVEAAWQIQKQERDKTRLQTLKPVLRELIASKFSVIGWSPDDTKILYQASESAELPLIIKPRRIGNNLLYEQRHLEKGSVYVYDITEDINTRIIEHAPQLCDTSLSTCTEHPLSWFPDSHHLVYVNDKKISIVEDDGSNMTTLYAGPFVDHYVYSWPDETKLVILTNFSDTSAPPTFYTISLK